MPWPPTPSTGFLDYGVTTIRWGTDGTLFAGATSYIVKSIRCSERIQEIPIENGTGITAVEILLRDGYDYEITVVDDSNITPPEVGDVMALDNPVTGSQADFLVCNNNYNAARKQEGERVILARSFTLISL